MTHTTQMLVTTEWFGRDGWMSHEERVAYEGQSVEDFVNEWTEDWQPFWNVSELGYGVIIAQDGVADDEWPEHAPSGLKWAVNKPYRVGMTMQELFAGVHKKENERYFLVYSKLDVGTKHSGVVDEGISATERVQNAMYWLRGLYLDVNGMLRQLKLHG